MSCWIRLGIEPTDDESLIRDAYRARLPEHHPESDPEGFQALRQAYESAIRFAREEALELSETMASEVPQALADFDKLLNDPARRFDPQAWQSFVKTLDQLPLGVLDDLRWALFGQMFNADLLSHRCASVLVGYMGWEHQLMSLGFEQARQAEDFLDQINEPDPFDMALMGDWSAAAQTESLWYLHTLDMIFNQRSLQEFDRFVSRHTCLPLPDHTVSIKRLVVQFTQAGIGGEGLRQFCVELQRETPDDVDSLYLLACQNSLLGLDDEALTCWVRLWQEHRHPKAESELLALCAKRQPDFLPLLIQAFDRLGDFRDWAFDLGDATQAYGSPSLRPETLARWMGVGPDQTQGLAKAFLNWRMTDDELPLLALLLGALDDVRLQQLYRHAWALHRGDVQLLQQLVDQPPAIDALEELVLSGFRSQARQQLRWLSHGPIPLTMAAFIDEGSEQNHLPEALEKGSGHKVCLAWLRRLRAYSPVALERIEQAFSLGDTYAAGELAVLSVLTQLSDRGVALPPVGSGEAVWQWHASSLYLLALLSDPERWLSLTGELTLEHLPFDSAQPVSRLQPLLRRLYREQGDLNGLLGWLQFDDPVHAVLARQLMGVQQALDCVRLLSNDRLYDCVHSDLRAFSDDVLGRMLLTGVLYHDPLMDAQQRRYLLERTTEIINPQDWFDGFRHSLIKGEPAHPPSQALTEYEGIHSETFYLALDALKGLVRYGSAGVPRQKILLRMQRAKDNPDHGVGLRLAFSALLSWSERLLLARADSRPASPVAFWRLNTRLARGPFFWQVLGSLLVTPLAALLSGTPLSGIAVLLLGGVFLLGAILRRLHDMGRGIPTLLILLCLSPVLPFLPLMLFAFPGDKLPNRYGVPPDSAGEDMLPGGLQATLRRLSG